MANGLAQMSVTSVQMRLGTLGTLGALAASGIDWIPRGDRIRLRGLLVGALLFSFEEHVRTLMQIWHPSTAVLSYGVIKKIFASFSDNELQPALPPNDKSNTKE